jgi:hypothetical protein
MEFRCWLTRRLQQEEVLGTKVLISSLDLKFDEVLKSDTSTYSQFYPDTRTIGAVRIDDLLAMIDKKYDIVHLFADVSPLGLIVDKTGNALAGASLIDRCCYADVKAAVDRE